jgi:predicted permease
MPDWRAYVREHLPRLACAPEREAEIVEEVAQQLQDIYDGALMRGASHAEAKALVRNEIHDWHTLARDLLAAQHPLLARPGTIALERIEPAVAWLRIGPALLDALRDARHTIRTLLKQPVFTIATIATFALGIGATTVVFSLVHSVLLSPLPYREPDKLVVARQVVPEIADRVPIVGVNARSFLAWQASCRTTCNGMAAIARTTSTITGTGEPEGLVGAKVSPILFDVLGTAPLVGRVFSESESVPGRDRVVILTYGFWQRRFGGDPTILGRSITLDGTPVEVVGVLPSTFRLPQLPQLFPPNTVVAPFDVFRPIAWSDDLRRSWGEYDNLVILRLKPGASAESAEAELSAIAKTEFAQAPIHPYAVVRPLIDSITEDASRPLWMILAAVAAALLIACVNVASLLGTRWSARQRELAIRLAMGAGWGRLAGLVAIESALLAATGGALGCATAAVSLRSILAYAPASVPRLDEVTLDTATLAVTAAVTMACAFLCALLPAIRAARAEPADTLKVGSHTTTASGRWSTIRTWLVGGEVALTTALLVVGGLLVASFINVLNVDRGFTTTSLVAADIELPAVRYPDAASRARFFDAVLAGLESDPSIEVAGLSRLLPLEGHATVDAMIPDGNTRPIAEQVVANHLQVSAGYFHAVGLPLVRGRLLTPDDHALPVAVINNRAALTLWPGQDPIGRSFSRGSRTTSWQIVGIVGDSRISGLEAEPELVAYVPYGLSTASKLSLAMRSRGDTAAAVSRAREVVRSIDPDLPLQRVRTLDAVLDDALAMRRFQIRLMAIFAAAGLLLACVGIFSALSGVVEGRRTELAIRLALGATRGGVQSLIVRQGLVPVGIGLAVGLAGGVAAAKVIASLLFGVTPAQPVIIAIVGALVMAVALAACVEPALRAARTPLVASLRGM